MSMPALVFDLDGTLVDSVYQHVLAWHEALHVSGIELSVWRIHRRIGMSGGKRAKPARCRGYDQATPELSRTWWLSAASMGSQASLCSSQTSRFGGYRLEEFESLAQAYGLKALAQHPHAQLAAN